MKDNENVIDFWKSQLKSMEEHADWLNSPEMEWFTDMMRIAMTVSVLDEGLTLGTGAVRYHREGDLYFRKIKESELEVSEGFTREELIEKYNQYNQNCIEFLGTSYPLEIE